MVQEATILAQSGILNVRERADQSVRQDHPGDQLISERGRSGAPQGPLEDRLPGLVLGDESPHLIT